jgi:transcriptional regulator with XRE-family HTH domain
MPTIAEDLRRWRLSYDKTQAEAAQLLQLSLTTYHRYERGRYVPPYRELQRLRMRMEEMDRGAALWQGPTW